VDDETPKDGIGVIDWRSRFRGVLMLTPAQGDEPTRFREKERPVNEKIICKGCKCVNEARARNCKECGKSLAVRG
jgi:hypothetical protein